jgi:hypothetical protein
MLRTSSLFFDVGIVAGASRHATCSSLRAAFLARIVTD